MTKHKAHPKKSSESAEPLVQPAESAVPPVPADAVVQLETPGQPGGALVEPAGQAVQRLSEELEQAKDRCLRLAAEFDNFRKRAQRERTESWGRAQAELVAGILDALDDLGRVAHLDGEQVPARDVLTGVELVERKLGRALMAAGLERVGAEGDPFDPNFHEAVTGVPAPAAEQDHRIASIMQPGYRFGGTLLRPARVAVYLWQEPAPADDPQAGS